MNASNPISTDYETFRASVRDFLKDALTPELIRAGERTTSVFSDFEAGRQWQSIWHMEAYLRKDIMSGFRVRMLKEELFHIDTQLLKLRKVKKRSHY